MKIKLTCIIALVLSNFISAQNKTYYPDSSQVIRQRLEEWQDLKFGLLMHWGAYAQWGIVESWSICPEDLSWAAHGRKKDVASSYASYVKKYEELQTTFNPVGFEPQRWAAAANRAGMKYLVFTTKHHDGFCMFDSKYTDYKITDPKTPFHTHASSDVTKSIFHEFRNAGFWIGAYFSKPDWHHPDYWWDFFPVSDRNCNYAIEKYPQKWSSFVDFTHGQIDELMSNYGQIDILWLDGGWVRPKDSLAIIQTLSEKYEGSRWARNPQSQDIRMGDLVSACRKKQPQLLVVDRAVPGPYQNYLTPEQHIPPTGLPYPWETCMTMATSWSFVPNDTYKSADVLITNLVDVVSKGGNFLLNIGPSPEGTFDSVAYARLDEIGQWMDVNSEAIYGSRMYDVFGEDNGIRYTTNKTKDVIYAFIPNQPLDEIVLPHVLYSKDVRVRLLGSDQKIGTKPSGEQLALRFPKQVKGNHVWVVEIKR
jgi:alpha-L-fucosidase